MENNDMIQDRTALVKEVNAQKHCKITQDPHSTGYYYSQCELQIQ